MPAVFSIAEAKIHLSELIRRAAGGEEIIIARADTPQARLLPLATAGEQREPGGWEGEVWIADDFDDPILWT